MLSVNGDLLIGTALTYGIKLCLCCMSVGFDVDVKVGARHDLWICHVLINIDAIVDLPR